MLGRPTSYSPRGLTTPRPGAFAARRPRSLLARAFARNSPLRHMDWILVVVVLGLTAIGTLLVWSATEPGLLAAGQDPRTRSEEHTSELQSHVKLVCRLLL